MFTTPATHFLQSYPRLTRDTENYLETAKILMSLSATPPTPQPAHEQRPTSALLNLPRPTAPLNSQPEPMSLQDKAAQSPIKWLNAPTPAKVVSPIKEITVPQEITNTAKIILPLTSIEINTNLRINIVCKSSSMQVSWTDAQGNRQLTNWCIQCKKNIVIPLADPRTDGKLVKHFKITCNFTHSYAGNAISKPLLNFKDESGNDYEIPIQFVSFLHKQKRIREETRPPKRKKTAQKDNEEKPLEPAFISSLELAINLNIRYKPSSLQTSWIDDEGIKHGPTNWCTKCEQAIIVPSTSRKKEPEQTHVKFLCAPMHKDGRPAINTPTPLLHFKDESGNDYEIPYKILARRNNKRTPENMRHLTLEDGVKYLKKDSGPTDPNPQPGTLYMLGNQ
jgi:hypothetical protein